MSLHIYSLFYFLLVSCSFMFYIVFIIWYGSRFFIPYQDIFHIFIRPDVKFHFTYVLIYMQSKSSFFICCNNIIFFFLPSTSILFFFLLMAFKLFVSIFFLPPTVYRTVILNFFLLSVFISTSIYRDVCNMSSGKALYSIQQFSNDRKKDLKKKK